MPALFEALGPSSRSVALHDGGLKPSYQLLNLLTFGLWSKLGRLTHYAFDAVLGNSSLSVFYSYWTGRVANVRVLVSAFLAGMKRSTGLT